MTAARVYRWDPLRPRLIRRNDRRRVSIRANNLGDMLGPRVVARMLTRRGIMDVARPRVQLMTVGSVLHHAGDDAVIWGSGWNPKVGAGRHRWSRLDVRAVRGPRTARFLRDRDVDVPDVLGDPVLLLRILRPDLLARAAAEPLHEVTFVPNLNERWRARAESIPSGWWVDPSDDTDDVLARIATSRIVVGSSLHAIVVAESLGVPARFVEPVAESPLKFRDYLEGTGRHRERFASGLASALRMGGMEAPVLDLDALLASFPYDLWA